MPAPIRRPTLGRALAGVMLAGGDSPAPIDTRSCGPDYISHWVPPVWQVGELDCQYFFDQGVYGIVLADPATDPHGLDDWNDVEDRFGREGY